MQTTRTSQAQTETIDCQRRDTLHFPVGYRGRGTLHRKLTHGYRHLREHQVGTRAAKSSSLILGSWKKRSVTRERSARSAITVLFVLAVFYTLYFARSFFLPVVLAVLLDFLLSPIIRVLKRWRVPESVGAAIVVAGLLGAGGGRCLQPCRARAGVGGEGAGEHPEDSEPIADAPKAGGTGVADGGSGGGGHQSRQERRAGSRVRGPRSGSESSVDPEFSHRRARDGGPALLSPGRRATSFSRS